MVGAFNVAREWIPARSEPVVVLPRRGRLVFQRRGTPAGGPIIGLSYLGFDGSQARFRLNLQLGPLSWQDATSVSGYWNVARVFAKFRRLQKLGSRLALTFIVVLLRRGLFIWESPVSRASALLVTVVAFVVTVVTARRGSYKPRVVVEMRLDQREGQRSAFSVVAGGQPAPADVRLHYPDRDRDQRAANGEVAAFGDLRTATFQIPASGGTEPKV